MIFIAIIIGTTTAIASTGRLTLSLLVSGTVCWSFVPVLQLMTGLILVRGGRVSRAKALALYFDTHRPWSLWLISAAMLLLLLADPGGWLIPILATAIAPAIVSGRAVTALLTQKLGFSVPQARRRAALHYTLTLAIVLIYAEYAGALIRRFVGSVTT
jgi:hypothetical protein